MPPGRLGTHTFGHIVPPQNVLPLALKAGPRGGALTFSFGSRGKLALLDELGEALLRVAQAVPHGVVVFVPSFQYEAQLVARWQLSGLWARLNAVKPLFREPRAAAELDPLLKEYAAAIRGDGDDDGRSMGGTGGAMLLSVVGGKMSEGINFSDALARVVVMVGLPYPNSSSPELREKMAYLDAQATGRGREYYENLCMRAVNQSIGRAIRHRADYACILLVDSRYYSNSAVRAKLPGWIVERLALSPTFGHMFGALSRFFRGKREVAKLAAASGGQ